MQQPLRLVSYNVRYFGHAVRGLASTRAGKRGIAKAIATLDPVPDVICLQEVETRSIRSNLGRPYPEETQLESFMTQLQEAYASLGREAPFQALYFRAHNYHLGEISLYTTGLAVLVNQDRLRIDRHNAEAPEGITEFGTALWKDQKQSRICAHMRLEDHGGGVFHLFNTHLSLPSPFAREYWSIKDKMGYGPNQLSEATRLVNFVQERAGDEPFVVCGDFNSLPGSPVFNLLNEEAGFVAPQLELGQIDLEQPRKFPTAGFMRLRMHLDHLFSDRRVRWLDLEGTHPFGDGPFHGLSDHMPLIGRFRIDPKTGLSVPVPSFGQGPSKQGRNRSTKGQEHLPIDRSVGGRTKQGRSGNTKEREHTPIDRGAGRRAKQSLNGSTKEREHTPIDRSAGRRAKQSLNGSTKEREHTPIDRGVGGRSGAAGSSRKRALARSFFGRALAERKRPR